MGLSLALNTARSSLLANATQVAVSARNSAGATDPSYSRKVATVISGGGGATVSVRRASDDALFDRMLDGTSSLASREALLGGLASLQQTVGDPEDAASPAAKVAAFATALQSAANAPDNDDLARSLLDKASDLAGSLNRAAGAVQTVRRDADTAIRDSVGRINDLLAQFDLANRSVMKGTVSGADVSDDLDNRDRILAKLSEEVGITTVARAGGDLAVYTDSGVPLFDRAARTVSFAATAVYNPGTVGAAVMIDGVAVTGAGSPMPLQGGRIAGLAELRDEAATTYEAQLDAMAGTLIRAFAETGTATPPDPARAGLFTSGAFTPGGAALLPAGDSGLATAIRIHRAADPAAGGSLATLRDGGMNGAGYRSNPAAAGTNAAYSGRLDALAAALKGTGTYAAATGIGGSATLQDFATTSAGWIEARRKTATGEVDYQTTLLNQASGALSAATGVSTDDEIARTVQLQQSYSASAKLISVIDDLMKILLNAVN
ncbi:flagellar hook-associated protein FlgK [uncultured Methylobacterium sp.]|jgi:flagellar hook-associated protein 1 FlgK|uniref:flagellar hook-associated protein FlgK n=1 Tax=uncultured Methylobacterium sp. TaxID=157278 RepID=UPI00262CF47D|nr:flagellar hook-associated protein FlgK [uncultured Methylobacterium sp.]